MYIYIKKFKKINSINNLRIRNKFVNIVKFKNMY